MERAAPWTEPEVRALIGIWSEEGIRRQLQGTLRNKGLFMYIALRMRQLGIFRDWKQCRSKYKNLKYEYRALRSSTRPPVYKIPFYDELHAILDVENQKQEGTEADPKLSLPADLPSCGGSTSDLLHVPSVHNEGGKHWSARETLALIHIWSDKSIRGQLKGSVRNQKIFEHIANLLRQEGIDRDWRQCRTKYKNLKHEYAVVKKARDSGNRWKTMKYFEELDAVLSGYRKTSFDRPSPLPCARTIPPTIVTYRVSEHPPEQEPSTGENVPAINIKEETSSVDDNLEIEHDHESRSTTINDAGGGRNWSDYEVQSLLHVWSGERISQQLDGSFRTKQVFEEISQKLMEFGINRDWKQCRRKYKNLKYGYHCIQKDENSEIQPALRQIVKFYDQIDHIVRQQPPVPDRHQEEHQEEHQEDCTTDSGPQDHAAEQLMVTVGKELSTHLKRKASPNAHECEDQKKHIKIESPAEHPSYQEVTDHTWESQFTEQTVLPPHGHACEARLYGSMSGAPAIHDQVCATTKERKKLIEKED